MSSFVVPISSGVNFSKIAAIHPNVHILPSLNCTIVTRCVMMLIELINMYYCFRLAIINFHANEVAHAFHSAEVYHLVQMEE